MSKFFAKFFIPTRRSCNSLLSSSKKWLILGHIGAKNTGDEAMLLGFLTGLDKQKRACIVVASKDGKIPFSFDNDKIETIHMAPIPLILGVFRYCGVILAGGTFFNDKVSGFKWIKSFVSMARYGSVLLVYRFFGKKVVMLGAGVGPLRRSSTKLLVWILIRFCTVITVRDNPSAEEIRRLGWKKRIPQGFDLSALMLAYERTSSMNNLRGQTPTLGISLTEPTDSVNDGKLSLASFQHIMEGSLKQILVARPNLILRIYVFSEKEAHRDLEISCHIYNALKEEFHSRIELYRFNRLVHNTYKDISQCDSFIAMRYHSAVFSYLAGCSILLLPYHKKVADFGKEVGLSSNAILEFNARFGPEELTARICSLLAGDNSFKPTFPITSAEASAFGHIEEIYKVF